MIILVLFSSFHIVAFVLAAIYWRKIAFEKTGGEYITRFSILIPVRNEAGRVELLLQDISRQSYPLSQFEVIVIDDHSEDDTCASVKSLEVPYLLKILQLPEEQSGKKRALTCGVHEAEHEVIITTDGDCRVKPDWIAAYASYYQNHDPKMVAGPVKMEGGSFFEGLQQLEFATLIGFGASALKSGNPSMCNGANLSYTKAVFLEVGGYTGNESIPSGDDEFLLQKVFRKYPHQVGFLKNSNAIVSTSAKPTFSSFINQRVRWTGKWKYHESWFVKVLAVLIFLDYFCLVGGTLLILLTGKPFFMLSFILLARYLAEVLLAWPVARFLGIRYFVLPSLAIQIIYPFCVSFLGFASIFGHYSWKGRMYK